MRGLMVHGADAILCRGNSLMQYYADVWCNADVIVWPNNMLMQQYDAELCWCNNLMQYSDASVQTGPWHFRFLSFNLHPPSPPPLGAPLNLFNYHINEFLKVIFSPKKSS